MYVTDLKHKTTTQTYIYVIYTAKPVFIVTSIKQSPVLSSHTFQFKSNAIQTDLYQTVACFKWSISVILVDGRFRQV